MPKQTLPATPGARIAQLIGGLDIEDAELLDVLDLPEGQSLKDVFEGRYPLSPTDLIAVADLLDVPVTMLTGQTSLDRHLGVSLRLGAAEVSGAPVEALEYAERLLQHKAVLDSWLGAVPNRLAKVPMSTDSYFIKAGEVSAARVRDALQLGDEPIADLLSLVEGLGFPVVFRKLPEGIHGLNIRDEREGQTSRVVVISVSGPWSMQRYSIAHELCHALYDDKDQVIVDRVDTPDRLPELRAERFARCLLLPSIGLRKEVADAQKAGKSWPTIVAELMLRWGVSRKMLTRALVDDGLASEDELRSTVDMSVAALIARAGLQKQWLEFSEGQTEESSSPLLVERAMAAFAEGWISSRVIAEILDTSKEAVDRELVSRGWAET